MPEHDTADDQPEGALAPVEAPDAVAEPPHPRNEAGEIRRVGVELEFGGIDAASAAVALAGALDGRVESESAHSFAVETPEGGFRVELDTRWAQPAYVRTHLDDLPEGVAETLTGGFGDNLEARIADAIGAVAGFVMPVEVIAPPLPWNRLDRLSPVIRALSAAGALGTRHSAFAGFGMHLNVEAASLAPGYLLSMLRAYVILAAWLRRESHLAPVRRVQSYIDPFPLAYARHILRPGYQPDIERLIRDHIAHNPSRNYELDMLPIFAEIAPELVAELLPEEKNAARPTFHWRLPDCRIDEPAWNPMADWARWVAVERLAADTALLAEEGERFLLGGPQSEFAARLARLRDAIIGD